MNNKMGFFFTLDAIFAMLIIIGGLLLIYSYFIEQEKPNTLDYVAYDMQTYFANLKISDIQDQPYVQQLIADGNITRTEITFLEQIGEFWALNKSDVARGLIINVTSNKFPLGLNFGFYVGNQTIYETSNSSANNVSFLVPVRKMVSGYEKEKPIQGTTSQAYLSSINYKQYSSYFYFGGFIGQGNVTFFIDDVPADATFSNMVLEADMKSAFYFYVNENFCNSYVANISALKESSIYDLSDCNVFLNRGTRNTFTIAFGNDLTTAYIAGGYLKIDYYTSQSNYFNSTNKRFYISGIKGIPNIYDSFYVPGNLNKIDVYLHYNVSVPNNTLFFTLYNSTIFADANLTGNENVTLSNPNITSFFALSVLDQKTVPYKFGFLNLSYSNNYVPAVSDIVVITDLSGSMDWRMDADYIAGEVRNCADPLFNDSSTQRLSVAKCLDVNFTQKVLTVPGTRVGLAHYSSSASKSADLQTNLPTLTAAINSYSDGGATCICCGLQASWELFNKTDMYSVVAISNLSTWRYYNQSRTSANLLDENNRDWYRLNFNDTNWSSGDARFATNETYYAIPYSVIGENISATSGSTTVYDTNTYVNIWEYKSEAQDGIAQFESGILNGSSPNTYGWNSPNDGWDTFSLVNPGPFDFDGNVNYTKVVSQKLTFSNNVGGENKCAGFDCSGSYGISLNITPAMVAQLSYPTSWAYLSFSYEWSKISGSWNKNNHQVWVKARFCNTSGSCSYLGNNLDSFGDPDNVDNGADSTPEIATQDNPTNAISSSILSNIKSKITVPGIYYLELGGKLLADSSNDVGTWRFDNVYLQIRNRTTVIVPPSSSEYYFFRRNFTVDKNNLTFAAINVYSDDNARIYVNENLIDDDTTVHAGTYYNRKNISIPITALNSGNNLIAVRIQNYNNSAAFDLELDLYYFNNTKNKTVVLMTDGVANYKCGSPGTSGLAASTAEAEQSAINKACNMSKAGIKIHAVGYSSNVNADFLEQIANCTGGNFTASSDISQLARFYDAISNDLVFGVNLTQLINVSSFNLSIELYPDSYIEVNYTPAVSPVDYGDIQVVDQIRNFSNCQMNFTVPSQITVKSAVVTSFSDQFWTDSVMVDGSSVFNLAAIHPNYTKVGDPFIIQIPAASLASGVSHTIDLQVGINSSQHDTCSDNNSLIYVGTVKGSSSYVPVLPNGTGCNWNIEYDDLSVSTVPIPIDYLGSRLCNYTSDSVNYDGSNSIDVAVYSLLKNLDYDSDNRSNINFQINNLNVQMMTVHKVPYLWGPAIVEVRGWY